MKRTPDPHSAKLKKEYHDLIKKYKKEYASATRERQDEISAILLESSRQVGRYRAKRNEAKNPGKQLYQSWKSWAKNHNRLSTWADEAQIEKLYRDCKLLTLQTGIEHEIDHIVPLYGRGVCGLHNQHNLRIVTKKENRRKSNVFHI